MTHPGLCPPVDPDDGLTFDPTYIPPAVMLLAAGTAPLAFIGGLIVVLFLATIPSGDAVAYGPAAVGTSALVVCVLRVIAARRVRRRRPAGHALAGAAVLASLVVDFFLLAFMTEAFFGVMVGFAVLVYEGVTVAALSRTDAHVRAHAMRRKDPAWR